MSAPEPTIEGQELLEKMEKTLDALECIVSSVFTSALLFGV
jgi:hypothetical protein